MVLREGHYSKRIDVVLDAYKKIQSKTVKDCYRRRDWPPVAEHH